jgi:outer membrane translocation and assembly module TamA
MYKVNVVFDFIPKLRYVFGTTTINIKSQKYNLPKTDISRELTYKENEIYNKEKVVNSELNLAKITILDNPRIVVAKIDSLNKKIYFVINAVVGNKYDLTPEIFGYTIQNTFYVGAGLAFSDNYFFGGGRILTTRARFYFNSLNNNRLVLENLLYQPYLFNNRKITGSWNFGVEYRLDETSNITQVKNNFGISYELPDYTFINRINGRWDTQNQRIILKEDLVQDSVLITKFDENFFQSLIGITLIHNTVNNIQFPSKGNYQSFDFAESGILGNLVQKIFDTQTLNYFQFTNFNTAYLNLTKDEINVPSVLAGKVLAGIIIEYGKNAFFVNGVEISSSFLPTETKYLCGGSSSIRGWGARQLGIVPDKNIGGNFIIENSIEHRIRPFLQANNTYIRDLGFATFIDFGNVWTEISKFKFNELALAAGGGIRYYTIIGAIRFDLGFKIFDPQPGTEGGSNWLFGTGCNYKNKYTFQFGIGNTF